jgi:HSP20 family molecular chaperone IbpA
MLYIDSVSAAKSKLKIRIKFLAGISETKVFCEVITTTREIKVINEFPDVSEEDINIGFYNNDLFINAEDQKRSYYEVVHLPNGVSGKGLK